MTRRAKKRWSYTTGEKGVNRVRVFEHAANGSLYVEFYDAGSRRSIPLQHQDRSRAKADAEKVAAGLRVSEPTPTGQVALQLLFDNYTREVTPRKSLGKQAHDRRATEQLLSVLGPARLVSTLTHRDAARFVAERERAGDQRRGKTLGRKLGHRQVLYDLSFARAVFNWGVGAGVLDRNPWQHYRPDFWKHTPRRPLLDRSDYAKLHEVANQVVPQFGLALVLAYETGHRIGAIRHLRWSDIDLERDIIRWRGENDKIGLEHETPMTAPLRDALQEARRRSPGIGGRWVFPAPKDPSQPASRFLLGAWWKRAEKLAKLKPEPGRGWHSCRRAFATDLKQVPLPDLCALGGWKDPQTILKCYQKADPVTMRNALDSRIRLKA